MRLPNTAHTSRPWRIHELTGDFRLEDVWALPTPGGPDDFPRLVQLVASADPSQTSSPAVRTVFSLRRKGGGLLDCDPPPTPPPPRPHALRDPVEGRGAARLGRPRRRARLQGADAPRPIAGGSARRPIRPGLRRAPLHVALPARGRVGGGDRQPDHARGHAPRLGPRPDGRLPRPDGRLGEAKRTARDCLHGRAEPVAAPDRVPADDATDRAELAGARGGEPTPAHAKLVARNGQMPTMNWDTAIDLLRRTPSMPGRVRQVAVPPSARTLSTLSHVDYEDAVLVETGPAQHRTGEQWPHHIAESSACSSWIGCSIGEGQERTSSLSILTSLMSSRMAQRSTRLSGRSPQGAGRG